MEILVVTPLYPPDIAPLAPYSKEFATRFRNSHTVSILTYGHLPEAVQGVRITTVEKRLPAPLRILKLSYTLWKMAKHADVVYFQNGPSVEVPLMLTSLFTRAQFVLRLGDEQALRHASQNKMYKIILSLSLMRAQKIIFHSDSKYTESILKNTNKSKCEQCARPQQRPEILPFVPYPNETFNAYESSWKAHLECISKIFV